MSWKRCKTRRNGVMTADPRYLCGSWTCSFRRRCVADRARALLLCAVVTGCADPPIPRHAAMRRDGDDVIIWCNNTSQQTQWKLRCDGSRWLGTQYNCSISTGILAALTLRAITGQSIYCNSCYQFLKYILYRFNREQVLYAFIVNYRLNVVHTEITAVKILGSVWGVGVSSPIFGHLQIFKRTSVMLWWWQQFVTCSQQSHLFTVRIITSAKEVIVLPGICLSVCLSVTNFTKNHWSDLHGNFYQRCVFAQERIY